MTGVRASVIFAFEDEFGEGKGKNESWRAPPPGTRFTHSYQRSTNRVDAMGTKTYDTVAFGAYKGTWSWTCLLDYEHLEPLLMMFEVEEVSGDEVVLKKTASTRVKSFAVRRVQLNRLAGGPIDEVLELRGCVCTTIRLSLSAGSSQWSVTIGGFCAKEMTYLDEYDHTDYVEYDGTLVQFGCLFVGDIDKPGTGAVSADNYVGLCDTVQIEISNNAETLDSICTPFSPSYIEGKTENQMSMTVYSNDPFLFKQRLYTGGQGLDTAVTDTTTTAVDGKKIADVSTVTASGKERKYLHRPLCKDLAPLPKLSIVSYDACKGLGDAKGEDIAGTVSIARRMMEIDVTGVVFKSMSWANGESKMVDQLTSLTCKDISIRIRHPGITDSLKDTGVKVGSKVGPDMTW